MPIVLLHSSVVVLAACFLACAGCGAHDSHATVTGTVTLDGAPLDAGTLEFRSLNGAGVVAFARVANGSFKVTEAANLSPGMYRIGISSLKKTGKQVQAGSPAPPGTLVDEVAETIPSRYNSVSELEKTVIAGSNTLEFELQE